jgi:trehalose 6-phosphate phosphatase
VTSRTTLLAFDFDGTLAPIRSNPSEVQMSRAAAALLKETTQIEGVVVALASGRDADDLAERANAPGAYIIGSHGLEIRGPGGTLVRDSPPLAAEIDPDLRDAIEATGLRLEPKKHGVALHWRGIRSDDAAPLADRFRIWAAALNLDLIEGRCVVEARCRGGGKEEALRWLASAIGASRVIYAGDDVTDFGALRFAAEYGRAVFVSSEEGVAPLGVTEVESFRQLFRLVRDEIMI